MGKSDTPITLMNGDLLIHLQTTSGSKLQFDTEFKAVTAVVESGFSPGKPIVLNDYIITTDSQQVTSLNCEGQCFVVDFESFRSNGEISNVFGNIVLPRNTAEGGYGQFELLPNGELAVIGIASYDDDWYGTDGVESWAMDEQKFILLVNDNANLKLYATNVSSTVDLDINNNQWDTILVLFCLSFDFIPVLTCFVKDSNLHSNSLFYFVYIAILHLRRCYSSVGRDRQ